MKNTKLYAIGMAIIALLGIISRLLDKQLAKLLFKSGNVRCVVFDNYSSTCIGNSRIVL